MTRTKRIILGVLLASISTTLCAAPASAVVDLTGTFRGVVTTLIPEVCTFTITQTGTVIELEQTCTLATDGAAIGTIDPSTGVFSAAGACGHAPTLGDPFTIEGSGSPDSYSIEGTFTCDSIFLPIPNIPYSASRCGNGLLDAGEECDDGDLFSGDGCSSTCETEAPPPFELVCRSAGKSILVLKAQDDDDKDKLIWKWLKGEETMQADFGVPTGTAANVLSVYSGTTGALLAQASVPGNAENWSPIGDKGWKYNDKAGAVDGIRKMILKGGDPAKAKIFVKGKGTELPDFPPDLLPLAADDFPITVQLFNSETEICWESVFESVDVKKNDAKTLRLKGQN